MIEGIDLRGSDGMAAGKVKVVKYYCHFLVAAMDWPSDIVFRTKESDSLLLRRARSRWWSITVISWLLLWIDRRILYFGRKNQIPYCYVEQGQSGEVILSILGCWYGSTVGYCIFGRKESDSLLLRRGLDVRVYPKHAFRPEKRNDHDIACHPEVWPPIYPAMRTCHFQCLWLNWQTQATEREREREREWWMKSSLMFKWRSDSWIWCNRLASFSTRCEQYVEHCFPILA